MRCIPCGRRKQRFHRNIPIVYDIRKLLARKGTDGESVVRHKFRVGSKFKHDLRVQILESLRGCPRILELHSMWVNLARPRVRTSFPRSL